MNVVPDLVNGILVIVFLKKRGDQIRESLGQPTATSTHIQKGQESKRKVQESGQETRQQKGLTWQPDYKKTRHKEHFLFMVDILVDWSNVSFRFVGFSCQTSVLYSTTPL